MGESDDLCSYSSQRKNVAGEVFTLLPISHSTDNEILQNKCFGAVKKKWSVVVCSDLLSPYRRVLSWITHSYFEVGAVRRVTWIRLDC